MVLPDTFIRCAHQPHRCIRLTFHSIIITSSIPNSLPSLRPTVGRIFVFAKKSLLLDRAHSSCEIT